MSGYCGHCGRPRRDEDQFCSGCGSRLESLQRHCPTCGQLWPEATSATVAAPAPSLVIVRGAYSSVHGNVYFDGTGWFMANEIGGLWLPNVNAPMPGFDPYASGVTLLVAETGATETVTLPRGPLLGPDYDPARDCGNCGFELTAGAPECLHCGTSNMGVAFVPGG